MSKPSPLARAKSTVSAHATQRPSHVGQNVKEWWTKGQGSGRGKSGVAYESTSSKTHFVKSHIDANIHGAIPARDGPSSYVFFSGTPVPRRQVENTMGEPVAMVKPQPTQRKKIIEGYVRTVGSSVAGQGPPNHPCTYASPSQLPSLNTHSRPDFRR